MQVPALEKIHQEPRLTLTVGAKVARTGRDDAGEAVWESWRLEDV